MKIIIFIHALTSGGAERVGVNLANRWAESGHNVTILTLSDVCNDFYKVNENVNRIGLSLSGESTGKFRSIVENINRIREIRFLLKKLQPDIALSFMGTANVILGIASIGIKNIGFIGSERTHPPEVPLPYEWDYLRKIIYRKLDSIVVLTDETALWMNKNIDTQRIDIIPNAAIWPIPLYKPVITPNFKIDDKVLLAVGRLSEEKRFDVLISIFSHITDRFPEWKLCIVGEGSERFFLEKLIHTLKLEKQVFLVGRVGNINQWYESSDIYLMSSRVEGFPNTLVEAMSSGLAAISFDCDTGPRDIIKNRVNGLLIRNNDLYAFNEAIVELMIDEKMRKRLSKNALEIRKKYSIDKIDKLWMNLFTDICNHKS